MAGLRLEVREYASPAKWRWVLTGADGEFIRDHEVRLDAAAWQFEAFRDVHHYLSWHVAPDRRGIDDTTIVAEVGAWITEQVLGPIADELAKRARKRPVTVAVVAPAEATDLLLRPLQLAHVNGTPLAGQDVTLVMQPDDPGADDASEHRDRLRVLGLFSLPEGGQPLNLRRERQALVTLVNGIAAGGKAAEVRVLQYGVTRDLLRDVLAEGGGWDIIHISGHGAPGELLLETADGRPDRVPAADLADLLLPARERVRLVTVAACWSAAQTVADQRRRLGLPATDQRPQPSHTERTRPLVPPPPPASTLATELTERLDCAVLAMRFPVDDDFAIALSGSLYELLVGQGQPLPQAVARALRGFSAERDFPALSLATPALFGARAVGLSLAASARSGPADDSVTSLELPGLPPQPDRFVGRVGVMARCSAALALRSGVPGVLLHGMPGGGKTACALELAYNLAHAFDRLVWYKAPDGGMDITGSLTDFALTLERYLPGFQMVHMLTSQDRLDAFLPRFAELAEQHRLLIVIDNAESLLTDAGQWRDDNWGRVVGALTGHKGLGRVILTSHRVPARLPGLHVESVDALSADEALLLVRELPHLRALELGQVPGLGARVSGVLARNAIAMAQGHPKLLELADGQAANPDHLLKLVKTGEQEWRRLGGVPEDFFANGATTASSEDYLEVLAAWTRTVAGTLSPGERDLFWFLCCLEEPDRERWILDANWSDLWHELGRDDEPLGLDETLAIVAATGLAAIRPATHPALAFYALHPGVAEAGRAGAGIRFRDAVDTEATAFWAAVFQQASGWTDDGTVHTALAVRAGLAAVPYLVRQQQWMDAAVGLEHAFMRDPSRANAAAMLPAIRQITSHDPRRAATLGLVLRVLDPAAGETVMHGALAAAIAAEDYEQASVITGRLMDLCLDGGRLAEALAFADQQIAYARQAGLGPWSQLSAEAQRLQVLNEMGQASHVLAEVRRLRNHMDTLPATAGPREIALPWNVREGLLSIGGHAALRLGLPSDALDLNADRLASQRDGTAPATSIAQTRFNDFGPLLSLGRVDEALALLQNCLKIFQDAHDTRAIGNVYAALAATEDLRGHGAAAIRFGREALRYSYRVGDVTAIAISYHNQGNYLHRHARQPSQTLASHLAAALIRALASAEGADRSLVATATDLREFGTAAIPPASVAALDRQLGEIPGTDLPGLIAAASPDPKTAEAVLRELIARAYACAISGQPPPPAASGTAQPKRRWWKGNSGRVRSE